LADSRKPHAVVNHKDCNTLNNRVDNLEWVTASYNCHYAYKMGRRSQLGEKNNQAKLNAERVREIRELYSSGLTRKEIAEKTGISRGHITSIISYKRWGHVA
jgi:DNA-binding NarL/FixJ family response regulator